MVTPHISSIKHSIKWKELNLKNCINNNLWNITFLSNPKNISLATHDKSYKEIQRWVTNDKKPWSLNVVGQLRLYSSSYDLPSFQPPLQVIGPLYL